MQAIGAWLATNGAAVYGTRPGPLQGIDGIRTTQRGSTVFVHVFDWPSAGPSKEGVASTLRIPGLTGHVSAASFLATGAPVQVQPDGQDGLLHLGTTSPPDPIDTVIAVEVSA